MSEVENSETEEFILYELLEYFVRKQEPELIKCKNDSHILPSTGTIKNALRYLNKRSILPESLAQYVSLTLPWKFAVGDNGKVLAILQENILEIRRLRDEYSSVIAKASVPKDPFPQWRKLAWSPDGSILALSSSNGNVSFYSSLGNNIFNINSNSTPLDSQTLEADDAVVSMIFKNTTSKDPKWDFEFIKVVYGGVLNSYNISAVNGYETNHRFDFLVNFYTNGINGIVYCEKRNLFFISGNNIYLSGNTAASEAGLTVWRPINDFPHYKLTTVLEDETLNKSRFSIWNFIPSMKSKAQTVIFKMSLNPNSELLACLHMDGTVSLWSLPNLKLQNQWKLVDQPDYNVANPINGLKTSKYPPGLSEFHPLDIGWWSNQALVIARYSGAISTCSINDLHNLLGSSPEFLFGPLQMIECRAIRGVLCLDCETNVMTTKRSVDEDETITESDKEIGDSESTTVFSYATNILQSTLYSMTDIEKFQPKRRKSKIFYRTYRILGLKSTTPDELYARKIEIEEYEEALNIANTYHLDKDLVYETQWRKSEFSLKAIEDHLSKVTKRAWVLNECVTRVPDNLIAARELLNFGLKKSSLQQMISLSDDYDNDETDFLSLEKEDPVNVTSQQAQKINQIISTIEVPKLNSVQKEIIRLRKKLLKHMDMLKAYEILLDSPKDYDKSFYQKFRQMSPIANAVRFAKDGNCKGVILMFTYFESQLIHHWLSIISFFPEALDPINYETLLPRCDSDDQVYLLDQEELRQKDWCERSEFQEIGSADDDNDETSALIYQNNPWFGVYRNTTLTQEILSDWYKKRCYEIERLSGLVDNALSLINIGKAHNIAGLETLLVELETLDDLVYKVGLKNQTLDDLDKLTDLEKVKLLMSQVNEANFICHVENTLIPFAKKKEVYIDEKIVKQLIQEYFVSLSKHSLVYIMEFVRFVTNVRNPAVQIIVDDYVQLAFNCMYSCDDSNMHNDARNIFDAMIEDFQGEEVKTFVKRDELEVLEKELNCLDILANYEVNVPLKFIRENKENLDNVKSLFVQVCERIKKEVPPVNEKTWSQLLSDLLDMQESVFKSFSMDACLEIYLETRLKSGIKSIIQNCANLMVTVKNADVSNTFFKVPFEKSVSLVLEASHEYFNNATSLVDSNMDLARTCLHLIETDHKKIKEEFDLISSLQLLYDFHLKILPLQVKLIPDKLKLIEDCLNSRSDSYKNKEKLLNVAKFLRIDNNARNREGKVLHLIARKAFQAEDFNYCSTVIRRLIELNHQPSWQVSSQLGHCDKFRDLKFRRECLWFVVNVGPDDLLQETIKYINVLDTEILDFDLQDWVDLNQSSFECDEFSDAISSPNVENREFIPKILESSSKLVKDSTLIVTQSMIDIMKNKDLWTGNFANFLKRNESSAIDEDFDDASQDGVVQSFPCFYESLHGDIKISNLDTKYNGFVMRDNRNDKFKLCQTLLRVQLLKESSCNGEQISDTSQLMIECAKNTITEDSTLALAYLLSIKKENIPEIQKLFANLPQTEFLIQLASYYCSIILFKSLNSDYEKVFEYDPSNLIKFVIKVTENDNENEIVQFLKDKLSALEKLKKKDVPVRRIETMESETDGWDDEWGDADWGDLDSEPKEIRDVDPNDEILLICEPNEPELSPCLEMSEDERYALFLKKYSTVSDKASYNELKHLLQSWPLFFDEQYFIVDKNPALKMVLKIKKMAIKITEEEIFEEFRDLLKDQIIPRETLLEFFHQNPDDFTIEEKLFLKLRSDDSFQAEVVEVMKKREEELSLPSVLLEEVFFQNLTPHFSPNHHMYHKIIEAVFMNRTIPEIQENIEILINKLMEQKNVPQAVALLSQLESIPPSLCTYDSCFERLLSRQKK